MKSKIFLTTIFLALLVSTTSMARKPAVDPVQEIDTSHLEEVPVAQRKGYDFSDNSVQKKKPQINTKYNIPTKEMNSLDEKSRPSSFVFVLLALLPMALWLTVIKSYKGPKEESELSEEDITYDKREDSDNKKAS